jgi:hypothetical protein
VTDARTIILELVPLADDVAVEVRLRNLLKTALRRDKFRCRDISQPPQPLADHDHDHREDARD